MSYEIAATGLNAVNEQLDGISNNIANSGTVGYKSMTTQFSAMYAGTQAMGVSVAGSAQSISTGGSMVSTGNALDLAINDDGFFVMCDSAGNISYTRAGSFVTDKNGYIVNASGDYLQGYPVDDSGTLQTGTVTDIQIKTGNIPAQATDSMTFTANFDASDETIDRASVPFDANNSDTYTDSYTTTVGDYELFCVENDAFRLMTIEKLLRANVRKVNKLFVSTAGNPAEHTKKDIVRYLCDARFVMNGPA